MTKTGANGTNGKPLATRADVVGWQATMRQALFEALDPETIREVVGAMVERAKKGDIAAARLLLTYAVGSPTVNVRNAVIMPGNGEPLPTAPTRALPNTPGKLETFAKRARNGQALFDPRDADHETGGRSGA